MKSRSALTRGFSASWPSVETARTFRAGQFPFDPRIGVFGRVSGDDLAVSPLVIQEAEGPSFGAACPVHPFASDDRAAALLVDFKVVGDRGWRPVVMSFAVPDLDADRSVAVAAAQVLQADAALRHCIAQPARETIGQKRENVEERGLAAAVWAEQHGQRRHVVEFHVAQDAVVTDTDAVDARRGPALLGHVGPLTDGTGRFGAGAAFFAGLRTPGKHGMFALCSRHAPHPALRRTRRRHRLLLPARRQPAGGDGGAGRRAGTGRARHRRPQHRRRRGARA